MTCPLESKINRLLRKEEWRWKGDRDFARMIFVIDGDSFCDFVEFKNGKQWGNYAVTYPRRSSAYRWRCKIQQMAIKTGLRQPDKPISFSNPLIQCRFRTYGELYQAFKWWFR